MELALSFLSTVAAKTQHFAHLRFNSTLQLINCQFPVISKNLLRYFSGIGIAVSLKIPFALSSTVFPDNLA